MVILDELIDKATNETNETKNFKYYRENAFLPYIGKFCSFYGGWIVDSTVPDFLGASSWYDGEGS